MPIERKLAAIMFTDIAGYTALSAKDENKALELLDKQKQILTPIIEEYNGTLHKEVGDGIMGASHAIESAAVFLCLFFSRAGNYSVHINWHK